LEIARFEGQNTGAETRANIAPNILLETGSIGFIEGLVRLQAEVAGDDFFLDLGGAAEARQNLLATEPSPSCSPYLSPTR